MSDVTIQGDLRIQNAGGDDLIILNGFDGSASFAGATHSFEADGNVILAGDQFHVNPDGKVTSYNGYSLPAEGNGVVSINGAPSASATDNSISATEVFTPVLDGLYELTALVQVLSPSVGGTVDVRIHHTDDVGAEVVTLATASLNTQTRVSKSVLIQAKANTPIQFSTAVTALSGHATYKVFVIAKRLT